MLVVGALAVAPPWAAAASFSDVTGDEFYGPAVGWLEAEGLTTGIGGSDRFEPDRDATRAEVVTVLWRLAGEPGGNAPSTFVDVPVGAYFDEPVRWAAITGVTTGAGGGPRFEPSRAVLRGEAVTMLWRSAGSPAAPPTRFVDVPTGAFFAPAVAWAEATDLTTGVGGSDRFEPFRPVTRGELAALIWRGEGSPLPDAAPPTTAPTTAPPTTAPPTTAPPTTAPPTTTTPPTTAPPTTTTTTQPPEPEVEQGPVEFVTAGGVRSCAIATGDLWCWGSNSGGSLGNGSTSAANSPQRVGEGVEGFEGITWVSSEEAHSCAVASGAVWCWGSPGDGRLGIGEVEGTAVTSPQRVGVGVEDFEAITFERVVTGNDHSCAIGEGELWCWGGNGFGQLGTGATGEDALLPVRAGGGIAAFSSVTDASIGVNLSGATCAVADGDVWCWGRDNRGRLSRPGDQLNETVPVPLRIREPEGGFGGTGFVAVELGQYSACALTDIGGVWCWGDDVYGNLGNGTVGGDATPTPSQVGVGVEGFGAMADLAIGQWTACATSDDGDLWCWGRNQDGQLGIGSTGDPSPDPVRVGAGVEDFAQGTVQQAGVGIRNHACARVDGQAWCWGSNNLGKIGVGAGLRFTQPQLVQVPPA